MSTDSKKWWRKVVAFTAGGGVVAAGLFGIVRATAEPNKALPIVDHGAWARSPVPTATAPSVSEVERSAAPSHGVVKVSATLPIPRTNMGVPDVPIAPLIPVPPAPFPSGLEPPVAGPRAPDAGLVAADKIPLPALPAVPVVDLPKVPAAPMDLKPFVTPTGLFPPPGPGAPGVLPITPPAPDGLPFPPLPGATVEPPKAPVVPVPAYNPPTMPGTPVPPQPAKTVPPPEPFKLADPVQPLLPVKPDSGLHPLIPGNTLNPPSPVAPAVPIVFPPLNPGGREVPATTVDRPKPSEPPFGTTDKFVFPAPSSNPLSLTPREAAMLNLKHTAALAVIGGALFTAENARSAALFPPIVPTVPATPVKADDKEVTDKLKKDLDEANKKIAALEKQVDKLTELLTGRKDADGKTILPSDPGAVEEIKRLKNRIAALDTELNAIKTQSSLKPAIVPEVKPKGVVKVVNEYPVEISMVINDKSHRIAPNTKIEVEVPAGDFSYQLLQSGAAATRSVIKDKETVTLRIK